MSGKSEPLISLVTVSYNCKNAIARTIESVIAQCIAGYADLIEYIIIDGASTDGTVEVIQGCKGNVTCILSFISENDKGIYDAMNKGIKKAKGQYIIFLNADDRLCIDSIKNVISAVKNHPNADIIYGDSISEYVYEEQRIYRYKRASEHIDVEALKGGMGCVHQSVATKTELLRKLHGFEIKFKVGADWDFLIRAVQDGAVLKYINAPICVYNREGFSANSHIKERHIIRKANNMYYRFDKNYVKDYFCIADIIKRFAGKKFYSKMEKRNTLKHAEDSAVLERKYIYHNIQRKEL